MQGVNFVFLLLPCLSALLVAYAVRHWALAAAVFFGSIGGLFTVPLIGGDARFAAPLLTGAALAAMIAFFILRYRPDTNRWTHATFTLAMTFAVHLFFLQTAFSVR